MIRSKKFLVYALLITAIFISSCKEDTIEPELLGNIKGIVFDAETNLPLSGVAITTSPPTNSVITNDKGEFELTELTVGEYSIKAEKKGYEKALVSVSVRDQKDTDANIFMEVDEDSKVSTLSEPYNPSPEVESTGEKTDVEFKWSVDSEGSDSVSFNVYLYEANITSKIIIAENITDTVVNYKNLKYNTNYFWQVIANDSKGNSTNSELYSFTTKSLPDNPYYFVSFVDDNYELFSTDGTEENLVRLTYNLNRDWFPRINRIKNLIAFTNDREVEPYLYTMTLDGQEMTKIDQVPVSGSYNYGSGFCWSPDGSSVYYPHNERLIKVKYYDGAEFEEIAQAPLGMHFKEVATDLSGQKLAVLLVGSAPYTNEIHIMNTDGTGDTLIVEDLPGTLGSPSFSIDGKSLLYTHDKSGNESYSGRQLNSKMLLQSLSDTTKIDLSSSKPDGTNDLHPSFSPDGAHVIFTNQSNDNSGKPSIWKININENGEIKSYSREKIADNGFMPVWK